MSESAKTLTFIVTAAATVALSFLTKPQSAIYDVSEQLGKMLTEAFEPESAKRLTIVKFNEQTAELREFEVAEQEGVWTIPSKGGYPADAFRQMAEAATGVTDREILSIASKSAADHEQFGVVDPRSPKLDVGQTGVGVRVTMADENEDPLADLIIGKEVKDQPEQRYVRRQSQDVVYVVKIDPDKFSTDFESWIEDDLLKINTDDLLRVQIKDYSFELVVNGRNVIPDWRRRGEYTLSYDNGESKWVANSLRRFNPEKTNDQTGEIGAYEPNDLTDAEALDDDVLRELRDALDDLKIVDVESKPAGLSGTLRVESDFLDKLDRSGSRSLLSRGFAPIQIGQDQVEVLSSEGEVVITMKDGVEYVLRFGNVESGDEGAEEQPNGDAEGEADRGVNRFMFVTTRFNESVVDKPELEELPEEETKGNGNAVEESPESRDSEAEDSEAENADADAEESSEQESSEQEADQTEAGGEDAGAERDAIIRRNKQRLELYEARLEAGKKRVEELNDRFGDWYYVVADSVYSKIRLGRNDFVKSSKEEGAEVAEAKDASVLGAPGSAVPGLPSIGGLNSDPAGESADE